MNKHEVGFKRPFKPSQLKWRKGHGNGELVYITARDVMDRLDQVCGVNGWQDEYDYIGGRMVCKISVLTDNMWISKSDGADDSNIEGAKGGLSDAFKRAAVKFGIGRYLYHPAAFNGSREPASWATPEGYDQLLADREGKEIEEWRREYSERV